ncbi:MAG: TolC family protein [Bacteroidetes bacterium]|nr:MAG: TolC family protein [Bacteroidota bacterium]
MAFELTTELTIKLNISIPIMFRKNLFLVLCLFCSQFAFAQEQWSIQQCIDYAIKNNVQLKISALSLQTNEANLEQSKMARLPNLNASGSQRWNFGRTIDPTTNQFTTDPVRSNFFQVASSTTVFAGGRINNSIEQNKTILEASKFDVKKASNDLTLNIINAYIQIVFNKELLQTAKLQLGNTGEQLDRTNKLIEAGTLPEINKYDIISQQANDELRVAQAENSLSLSFLRLKQLLQLTEEQNLDIISPQIAEPNQEMVSMSSADIFMAAVANMPEVRSADLNIQSANLGVKIAEALLLPTLSFDLNMQSNYSSLGAARRIIDGKFDTYPIGFLSDNPSQIVSTQTQASVVEKTGFGSQISSNLTQGAGFSLNIPIFNRYQNKTQIANAKIQRERTGLNAQAVRNQLRQNIEQAYVDAKAASKSFYANKIRVEALENSLKAAEQRLTLGSGNSTDYAIAKNNFNVAQSDLLRAKFNYLFTLKVLDFYAGKELKL